jgi:hypothetical protein
MSVTVSTKALTRSQLAVALGNNQTVVRLIESLSGDVTGPLPTGIDDAQTTAAAAQETATAAQQLAQTLQALAFVLISASADAPNGVALAEGTGISVAVGEGAVTISLSVPVSVENGGTGADNEQDARKNLGLGTMATQAANEVAITGGAIDGADIGDTTPAKGSFSQLRNGEDVLLHSTVALSDGAAAAVATLTNAPTAGDPTKWVPVDDNGTTRYVPMW